MAFAKVNGANIHYEVRGEGPRVLFIHGIGADMKNPISIFNTPISHKFEILAFDPRGLGESESENLPHSIAGMADDAAGLAEAIGWKQYHVLGASMGGMVAQELVLRYPSAVNKLVLAVTHAGGEYSPPPAVIEFDQLSTAEMLRLSDTRQDEAWMAANPELVAQAEQGFALAKEAKNANPSIVRGFNNQAEAVLKHNTFDRLSKITSPTFVFAGRYDGGCPYPFTQAMAEQIPGSRFELVESGHGGWVCDQGIWEMISEFLLDS